jgi:hypothetical protein
MRVKISAVFLFLSIFSSNVLSHAGQITRLSVDSAGKEGNAGSFGPAISANGFIVTFDSDASNLVTTQGDCGKPDTPKEKDCNNATDIFVYDRNIGGLERE